MINKIITFVISFMVWATGAPWDKAREAANEIFYGENK